MTNSLTKILPLFFVSSLIVFFVAPSIFAYEYHVLVDLTSYDSNTLTGYVAKIVAVFTGDIFKYFPDALRPYDSDLKKKMFLSSPDADQYRQQLAEAKAKYLTSSFKTTIGVLSRDNRFNLQKQGFVITVGEMKRRSDGENNKNWIDGFWFPMLAIWIQDLGAGFRFRKAVINMPEVVAAQIEGKEANVVAYFQLTGKTHVFERELTLLDGRGTVIDEHYPIAKNLTIAIEEKLTGNVLYRKTY